MESSLISNDHVSEVLLKVGDQDEFLHWVRNEHPDWNVKAMGHLLYKVSGLTPSSWKVLQSAHNMINYIDRADRVAREETVLGDFDQSENRVTSVQSLFPDLNGDGLTLSIKEKPFDVNDLDLRGRIKLNEQFDEPATPHATFMATLSAGAGNTSSFARGAAWASMVTTSDFNRLLPDEGESLLNLEVTVQNHSYGVGLENYYGIESSEYDSECLENPKILHVFSSGNQGMGTPTTGTYAGLPGWANLTGQFKVSKNTLSVGSSDRFGRVVSMSSRGPAYDGRVKPELIAFGDAGSSEAAAVVSGISLLVQQDYKTLYGELPDAALVKSILLTGAQDTGRPHVDYETGYGNANALNSLRITHTGQFFSGFIGQDEVIIFPITISADQYDLKVTLTWHDEAAEPFASKALINDLDLSLRSVATDQTWLPWVLDASPSVEALQQDAVRGIDRINNVEQVTLEFPASGNYEILVRGHSIPSNSWKFHLAFQSRVRGFEWHHPLGKDALRSGEENYLRWQWNNLPAVASLEYRFQGETNWKILSSAILLEEESFVWTPPDTAGLIQLRMLVDGVPYESEFIALSKPQRLKVGFTCEDEVMLLWNRVPSADQYMLYSLGEKYLEPIVLTTDTFAILEKNQLATQYITQVPVFSGIEGSRELTINYEAQGTGCYFISFIPRELITDSEVIFDVQLGTVYNLREVVLERWNGLTFDPVESPVPVPGTAFSLNDTSPVTGNIMYRAKLTTVDGDIIYSDQEHVLVIHDEDCYLYPNPLSGNQELNIVINDVDLALIQIMDLNGRVIREAEDFGPVKTINTIDMRSGTYLVRIQRHDGATYIQKLVVIQ
jgi:hypothetical protein